jgi:hypothetical protein
MPRSLAVEFILIPSVGFLANPPLRMDDLDAKRTESDSLAHNLFFATLATHFSIISAAYKVTDHGDNPSFDAHTTRF